MYVCVLKPHRYNWIGGVAVVVVIVFVVHGPEKKHFYFFFLFLLPIIIIFAVDDDDEELMILLVWLIGFDSFNFSTTIFHSVTWYADENDNEKLERTRTLCARFFWYVRVCENVT